MCSRFEIKARPRDLARRFGFDDLPDGFTAGEVRPTDPALVLAADSYSVLPWGLNVSWGSKPLINARAETLAEKTTFRALLDKRCLIPATAYFEWRRDDRGRRLKNRIAPVDEAPMAFAGLHDGQRFVIVTCAPSPAIAHIHNRMPVVLDPAHESGWCDPERPFADAARFLTPAPDGALCAIEDTPPPSAQPDLFG